MRGGLPPTTIGGPATRHDSRISLTLIRATTLNLRQLRQSLHHLALRIGERIDHREVVGAGDLLVAGIGAVRAPGFHDAPALAQELARFEPAHGGLERAASR